MDIKNKSVVKQTEDFEALRAPLRTAIDAYYDMQQMRISLASRICFCLKKDFELSSVDATEGEESEENTKLMYAVLDEFDMFQKEYDSRYKRHGKEEQVIAELQGVTKYITSGLVYRLVRVYKEVIESESGLLDACRLEVQKHPMWDVFFKGVKGCGPLMSGVCLVYLNPYKAEHPSSFWKYAGLDVVEDEDGTHGRSARDLVEREYVNKSGELAVKKSLSYNPVLKSKLIGVLGTAFLRAGKDNYYAKFYYQYKDRITLRSDCMGYSKAHIHRMAIRYMIKQFLRDLWVAWRSYEGLPVSEDYAVAMLGAKPRQCNYLLP